MNNPQVIDPDVSALLERFGIQTEEHKQRVMQACVAAGFLEVKNGEYILGKLGRECFVEEPTYQTVIQHAEKLGAFEYECEQLTRKEAKAIRERTDGSEAAKNQYITTLNCIRALTARLDESISEWLPHLMTYRLTDVEYDEEFFDSFCDKFVDWLVMEYLYKNRTEKFVSSTKEDFRSLVVNANADSEESFKNWFELEEDYKEFLKACPGKSREEFVIVGFLKKIVESNAALEELDAIMFGPGI